MRMQRKGVRCGKECHYICQGLLLNAPQEGKHEEEDWCGGLAHGVEAEGDQGEAEVGQANVQPRADAIGEHCRQQACWKGWLA